MYCCLKNFLNETHNFEEYIKKYKSFKLKANFDLVESNCNTH